jgi:hypothetical protein
MIELLNSNYPPVKTKGRNFSDTFFSLLNTAVSVKIASGYISEESIADLLGLYKTGFKAEMNLIVGMHYFEGFTLGQYDALISLAELLKTKQCGSVFLSKVSKYHGKVYSFSNGNYYSAIIGSSNLTKINTSEHIYDTDLLICNENINIDIENFIADLQSKYCCPIHDIKKEQIIIKEPDNLFENYLGVEKIKKEEVIDTLNACTNISFEI